jgi:molybdopterin synthase catalytic subunit
MIKVQLEDFNINELATQLKSRENGCLVTFLGTVRNHAQGKEVTCMTLEIYPEMAVSQLQAIRIEALDKFGVNGVTVVHRYGDLKVGENIVFIGVSAGHRAEAFEACSYIIDELKQRVPIWKKEYTPDGTYWVEGEKHE